MSGVDGDAGGVVEAGKPDGNYWFRTGSYSALVGLSILLSPVALAAGFLLSQGPGMFGSVPHVVLLSIVVTLVSAALGPITFTYFLYWLIYILVWGIDPGSLHSLCCIEFCCGPSNGAYGFLFMVFTMSFPGSVVSSYFCFHFLFRKRQANFREALWLTLAAVLISACYAGYSTYLEQTRQCSLVRCNF